MASVILVDAQRVTKLAPDGFTLSSRQTLKELRAALDLHGNVAHNLVHTLLAIEDDWRPRD